VFVAEISDPFDYTTFNLPVGYSKYTAALNDISLFASFDPEYVLNRLPKKIENIVFSEDGQKAVVFESDVVSFYDVASNSMTEIPTLKGGWGSGVFNDDFYTIGYDDASKKYALKVVNLEDGKVRDLVYFIRNIKKYKLKISKEQQAIVMVDQTNIPNILYLIDINEATRKNVYEADYIELGDITPAGLVAFATGENQFNTSIKYLSLYIFEVLSHSFKANILNVNYDNRGIIYFVSDTPFAGGDFYESESDIVTIEDLTSSYAEPQNLGLYKYDGGYELLMDLSEQIPAVPDRIEVSEDGSVVRMLIEDKYYDVKVAE
jgi:hypothetical protein